MSVGRKRQSEKDFEKKPKRMGRLSMGNVELADALKAAMEIPVKPKARRAKKAKGERS